MKRKGVRQREAPGEQEEAAAFRAEVERAMAARAKVQGRGLMISARSVEQRKGIQQRSRKGSQVLVALWLRLVVGLLAITKVDGIRFPASSATTCLPTTSATTSFSTSSANTSVQVPSTGSCFVVSGMSDEPALLVADDGQDLEGCLDSGADRV